MGGMRTWVLPRPRVVFMPQKMLTHYKISLHVDDEAVICSLGRIYGFRAYQLDAQDDEWKEKIIERANQVKKLEHYDL